MRRSPYLTVWFSVFNRVARSYFWFSLFMFLPFLTKSRVWDVSFRTRSIGILVYIFAADGQYSYVLLDLTLVF